jgi:hypothetical protein
VSTVPPGLQPLADDLHSFGMAMTHEQWEERAERIAEHWAPLMFKALLAVFKAHPADEDGDCSADGDPWPCQTLCAISQAMTPPTDPFTAEETPA